MRKIIKHPSSKKTNSVKASSAVSASTREELSDKVDELYSELWRSGKGEVAEQILYSHNASEDDSDEEWGFMATMSDEDMEAAIREFRTALAGNWELSSIQRMIYQLQNHELDASPDYGQGFIDACKMLEEEYELGLKF